MLAGTLLDPVILFFVLGLCAGAFRSDLRLPEALYETLSIYLLAAIGLKGGVELASGGTSGVVGPFLAAVALGLLIPPVAFAVLSRLGGFGRADAAAIAAHYGSVSVVTFAVAVTYLERLAVPYEEFVTALLVIMEIPGIAAGIVIARAGARQAGTLQVARLAHEVVFGKTILLLGGGLLVGYLAGPVGVAPVAPLFFDLFRGALAFFLLEMGVVAARRLADLRRAGPFLVAFGIGMPLLSALMGTAAGALVGLSVGGTTVLATLAASASYIAATAAMRVAVPEANPTLYVTASLGVTFPFNIIVGIPVYHAMARWLVGG